MSAIFGEKLSFPQEKGPDVKLVVHGDDFYARYETENGYTAVYDPEKGLYCYALLIDGQFVSSGVDISKKPPNSARKHLKEAENVRNEKFEKKFGLRSPPASPISPADTLKTFGPNKGLLEGRRLSEGEVKGLTILVQFRDMKSTVTKEDVSKLLNGEGYCDNGNFCSVRDYFKLISNGKLDYTNEIVGPITLKRNRIYYTQKLLVKEALDAVYAMGIDFSKFDSMDQGIIDSISFLYAGQTVYQDWLWPHNSYIDLNYGNVKTNLYMLASMGRSSADLSIGTFCHESGHMLCRWPDLYDYGTRDGDFQKSAGLGYYCLMSAGNHNNNGRTPAPVCAYLRDLVGWCDNIISLNIPGDYQANQGDYSTIIKFETQKFGEYYLIENRSKKGLDSYIPSGGLAVYHCDINGSNEWQGGTATQHYQCGLLQADGHLDLEVNQNMGDEADMFRNVSGIALSHQTKPASLMWDGSDSGLILSDIGESGDIIKFRVGEPVTLTQVSRSDREVIVR